MPGSISFRFGEIMSISRALLQEVMQRLQHYSDIPIPYGSQYERDLTTRARALIELIEEVREREAVARAGGAS